MSSQRADEDVSILYKKFESFGRWTKEERIGDYPVLGGDSVSPSYLFQQVTKKYMSFGDVKSPRLILESLEGMRNLGCDDSVLIGFLMSCDYESGQHFLYGSQYIKDIEWVTKTSRNKEEFDVRARRIYDANVARHQALNGAANLKDLEVLKFKRD